MTLSNPHNPGSLPVTAKDVLFMFHTLQGLGYRPPQRMLDTDEQTRRSVQSHLMLLENVTRDELQAALKAFLRRGSKFWPSAGEITGLIPRVALQHQDRSEDAWGQLMRMMGSPGCAALEAREVAGEAWVDDPEMDRRMKHAARCAGGVRHLGRCHISEQMANRASFRKAYQELQGREQINNAYRQQIGVAESNLLTGAK